MGMNSSSTADYRDNTALSDFFIQEIRLSSQWEGPLQLVSGLYYEDIQKELHTFWSWGGDPSGNLYPNPESPRSKFDRVDKTEQKAIFGELSYHFTEQWEGTVGGRYFDYEVDSEASLIFRGNDLPQDLKGVEETGQNYKAAVNYAANEDLLIYGQWAEGFRLGRPQALSPRCASAIDAGVVDDISGVESDTSSTFELGVKSSWNDNRITLNAAIYHTDWEDIPIRTSTAGPDGICSRLVNAGEAKSEGVEVEFRARLTDNVQLDISASTVDATLENDVDFGGGLSGEKGDDLPGSADYNATVGLEYGFILGSYPSFARLDYAYVGEYYNNLQEEGTSAGDFGQVHVKLGSTIGQFDVDVFVNNLTNDDGLTWVEDNFKRFSGTSPAYRIRPRSIGINIGYSF